MDYITIKEAAAKWEVSERMVRMYCSEGRIKGALVEGKSWFIPANAKKPTTKSKANVNTVHGEIELSSMAKRIRYERSKNNHFGIYEYVQVNLTYSSNRMASNRLTREQVIDIFRTGKVSGSFEAMKVDDAIEAVNHIACVKLIIDQLEAPLTQEFIKRLHTTLFYGTFADRKEDVRPGHYRNERGRFGVFPSMIRGELAALIDEYEHTTLMTLEKLVDFHVRFEKIHPFEDGNGRVGRLILVKECLRFGICPLIIDDKRRKDYFKGIDVWDRDRTILNTVIDETQKYFFAKTELIKRMQYLRRPVGYTNE